jgi:UDP-N-acetylmuramyl pentapeptide phosphotransferase/UDP-N-acetylglucosamine-1-phosphate transferase
VSSSSDNSSDNRSDDRGRAGDGLVRTGGIVFIIGAVATLVTVAPLFLGMSRLPTPAYAACMLMPLGLLLALIGVLRSALSQRGSVAT